MVLFLGFVSIVVGGVVVGLGWGSIVVGGVVGCCCE